MTEEEVKINLALDAIRKKDNGNEALTVLEILAYFDNENIHTTFLSHLMSDEKVLKSVITLLKQYSLIYSGQDETLINISKTVQKVMIKTLKKQKREFQVLKKTFEILLFMQGIDSSNLNHAISVWDHVVSYPEIFANYCSFPSSIIEEFTKQLRYEEGEVFGFKALGVLKKWLPKSHEGLFVHQHHLGLLLGMAGKQERALGILLPLFGNDREHSGLRKTLTIIAKRLKELSRFDEALKIYKQAIFHNKKVSQANDDTILSAWHDYANLLCDMEKNSEAIVVLKGILKRRGQILAGEDEDTLALKSSLANILVKEAKYSDAMNIFCQVFNKRKALFGENNSSTLRSRRDIASVLQYQGKFDEALAVFEDLIEKCKQVLGIEHCETLAAQGHLGSLFEKRGEYEKALEIHRYVLKKRSETLGEKHPDTLGVKYHIASILFLLEKHDEALRILQDVYEAYIQVLGTSDPKTVDLKNTLETLNSLNLETIFSSAWEGDLKKVKSMITNGIDINNTDFHKNTPLHYAVERGHASVVKFLLEKGAIYNSENKVGKTPIQITRNSGIEKLLTLVANLIKNAREGNHEQLSKHIAKNEGIVNAKDNDGSNALHWAAHNGHKDIVKLFLENGADATHVTNKGNTPLHIATSKGHGEIIEVLLQYVGRDDLHNFINAKTTGGGVTSIHVAAKNGYLEIVKSLLKHGAVYDSKNKQGKTPLQLSKDRRIIDLLKLTNELFQDAKNGNPKIISKLQHLKPDEFTALKNARNDQGNTLLQVLKANKHESIAGKFYSLDIAEKPDQAKSLSDSKYSLDQIEKLKRAAQLHIRFAEIFLQKLQDMSQPDSSEKNSSPWNTLREGSHYLEKVYEFVEEYKACVNNSIYDENIQAINVVLVELGFDRKHITVGRTNEAYGGRVECFVSKGQGTRYYELLHSQSKSNVILFVEMAQRSINLPVKRFLESLKEKLKYFLPERLFKVVENNNYLEVEVCIREGADINSKRTDGRTPLHYAVNNGNLDITNDLLKNGADVTRVTTKGNTPLHIATSKGDKAIVKVLLEHASRNKLNDFINAQTTVGGTTSLHVAAKNGSIDIVKSLLRHGAIFNIENKEGKQPLELSEDQNIIALLKLTDKFFQGAKNGNIDIIIELREMESDEVLAFTNARNKSGNTLLQVAKNHKHKNIEIELSEMVKKPDQTESWSSLKSRMDKLKHLQSSAEVNLRFAEIYLPMLRNMSQPYESEDNISAWAATKEGSYYLGNAYSIVTVYKSYTSGLVGDKNIRAINDILVELQFDRKYNSSGYTDEAYGGQALCFVSKGQGMKYYELLHSKLNRDVKLFVELGERNITNAVKNFLESVKQKIKYDLPEKLFKAIDNNDHSEVEDCIREEGLIVNLKNTDGRTSLHYAVNNGNIDMMNILLKNGADVTQVSAKGNTPLHTATSRDFKEVVKVLLQHASRNELDDFINAQTTSGGTASLHVAAKNGSIDIVKSLLKHGAIFSIENKEGKTPLDLSKDSNVTYLLKLAKELFQYAENGDFQIISRLNHTEPDEFVALTNARDNKGNTLLQVAINNKYKNTKSKFLELFRNPDQIQSLSRSKSKLEQFEMLQEVAGLHIKISQLYLLELRSMSESGDPEKISSPSILLRDGSYYLRNAYNLVEIYKCCANSSIDNEHIQAVNDMLVALEFDPEHVTSYANEVSGDEVESFLSKGQGKQYYKLLHSGLKKDVRLFIKLVTQNIEIPVKKFSEAMKQKLQNVLPEKLFQAIENNNKLEVEGCIGDGADVNFKNADRRTPLHYAAYNGNLDIVLVLLNNGADCTQATSRGNTPLHIATSIGSQVIVEILLQRVSRNKFHAFINAQTLGGNTSLHVAAKNGFFNVARCLLKYGAIYNPRNKEGKTPLDLSKDKNITELLSVVTQFFQDAEDGSPEIVDKMRSLHIETTVAVGMSHNAEGQKLGEVMSANEHKINFFLANKRLSEIRDFGFGKLSLDQLKEIKEAAELCIKSSESYLPMLRNTSQSNRSDKNSFPWATLKAGSYYLRIIHGLVDVYSKCMDGVVEDKNIQAIDIVLEALEFHPTHITSGYTDEAFDGKVKCFVSTGQGTAYYELLHSNSKKDVRSFLEIIDPNIDVYVRRFLETINQRLQSTVSEVLFRAIENNNNLEVRKCVTEELVINFKGTDGKTPLHYAVNNGNVSIINTLLKHGGDVSQRDSQGETPLHIASSKNHKKIVGILLQNVPHDKLYEFINAQCIRGNTSLHIAAKNGCLEIVESLLKHGAIYNVKNLKGETALDLSQDNNISNLLKLVGRLFEDAKSGNLKIIRELKAQPSKLAVISNTRNDQGKSLVQVAISNKHQSLASKLEMTLKTKSNSTGY